MAVPQPVTAPPVPTRSVMVDNGGLATRPWIAWFTDLGQQFGFFQNIQSNGTDLPQELGLNFLSPLTATDNPANRTIDIGIGAVAPVQTVITVAFGTVYHNTGTTPAVLFLSIRALAGTAGTATVFSDAATLPTTRIGMASAQTSGGSSVVVSLPFEVMPGNYFRLTQDTGSLSVALAVKVQ